MVVGFATAAILAASALPAPVAAESLFGFLFGGFRRPPSPPPVRMETPDTFFRSLFGGESRREPAEAVRSASGPHSGYCVRLCDGHYFPVQARRNMTVAEQCQSFCPATETKVFSGGGIEHAVAPDGRRYTDLPNAFAYRKKVVAGCTCNGKSPAGLASIPLKDDPTLRSGDIVVTNAGFTVYNGRKQGEDAFTPLDSARVSKSVRNQLADVKIMPRPVTDGAAPSVSEETTSSIPQDRRRFSARER
jgi:hypothetical protein